MPVAEASVSATGENAQISLPSMVLFYKRKRQSDPGDPVISEYKTQSVNIIAETDTAIQVACKDADALVM